MPGELQDTSIDTEKYKHLLVYYVNCFEESQKIIELFAIECEKSCNKVIQLQKCIEKLFILNEKLTKNYKTLLTEYKKILEQ